MSTITASLRSLLKSDVLFAWGPEQANSLKKIKEILSTAPVLSYFDSTTTSTIQELRTHPEVLGQQRATMLKLKKSCWL